MHHGLQITDQLFKSNLTFCAVCVFTLHTDEWCVHNRLFNANFEDTYKLKYTGYFTSDNEPGGIENATHNTLEHKPGDGGDKYPAFPPDVLWVTFAIPQGSLSLVKCPVD
jgi:hypothetical protein